MKGNSNIQLHKWYILFHWLSESYVLIGFESFRVDIYFINNSCQNLNLFHNEQGSTVTTEQTHKIKEQREKHYQWLVG